MKRVILRILGAVLIAGAAIWLVFTLQHVLDVVHHRGQVHVNDERFLRPLLVALAKALFPAGALFGCGLWALEAARRVWRGSSARWTTGRRLG